MKLQELVSIDRHTILCDIVNDIICVKTVTGAEIWLKNDASFYQRDRFFEELFGHPALQRQDGDED